MFTRLLFVVRPEKSWAFIDVRDFKALSRRGVTQTDRPSVILCPASQGSPSDKRDIYNDTYSKIHFLLPGK